MYRYAFTRKGPDGNITKYIYAESLVDAKAQYKEEFGLDPEVGHRITRTKQW